VIIDPEQRTVEWLTLDEQSEYRSVERSRLVPLSPAELAEQIDWP